MSSCTTNSRLKWPVTSHNFVNETVHMPLLIRIDKQAMTLFVQQAKLVVRWLG
eukprot:m.140664 g.140664  ORF g.140664 m.140664 type:complete len:53 (-) comp16109_c0_seq2:1619-1777(-)